MTTLWKGATTYLQPHRTAGQFRGQISRAFRLAVILAVVLLPSVGWAQIDFPKSGYHAAMGDSVAAGEGACL